MSATINKVWRAVCTVGAHAGAEAGTLRAGEMPCSIRPVAATGGGIDLVIRTSVGE